MARKQRMAIELLSDISSKAYDLQVYTEPEIQAALAVLRSVNGPMFDWLTRLLVAGQGSPTRPDVRAIVEALGFDPTNHHNALVCAYCNPDKLTLGSPTKDEGPKP